MRREDDGLPMTLSGLIIGGCMNSCLAALGLNRGELVITLIAILILYCAKRIPNFLNDLRRGVHGFRDACDEVGFELGQGAVGSFGKPADEALTVENQSGEFYDPPALRDVSQSLKDEQKQIRPVLKLLGWMLVCAALLALIACLLAAVLI
jgi:Sec-independent protein translocase protein TatA